MQSGCGSAYCTFVCGKYGLKFSASSGVGLPSPIQAQVFFQAQKRLLELIVRAVIKETQGVHARWCCL